MLLTPFPLSQTVTPSQAPSPSSVTLFMNGQSHLKESTAWVLHNAYKLTSVFLLLSPIRCLCLSLRIPSAQHPFVLGRIHLDSASTPPSFHLPLCLLPCLSPASLLDRARPC